jgi:hypothetical protein
VLDCLNNVVFEDASPIPRNGKYGCISSDHNPFVLFKTAKRCSEDFSGDRIA